MDEHDNKTGSQKQGGWTPGPWKACGTIYEHMNAEIRSGRKGEGHGIAQVWDGPNAFNDALMMAASPDLAAALIESRRALWVEVRGRWDQATFDSWAVVRQIDAALEKARANPSTDQGEK